MPFKVTSHLPTDLSRCKTLRLFTCFLNIFFHAFNLWWCVSILFVTVSLFFFSRLMKDWNSTNASKYRNNKDFGFCSFPKSSGYTSYSFGAAKPWADVFVEKAVVRPGLLFWRLTHHLCLNLGLLFLICIDVVFTGTKFCLTSYCPVALSHSTVVILHNHHSFLRLRWLSVINKPH